MKGFDKRLKGLFFFKQLLIFYSLKIPSPDEEREVDLGTFVDQEDGDIDDESDVELDLDLDSEHNDNDDDLESDSLLSDSVDRAGSAEEFQWSLTFSRTGTKLDNTNLLHSLPPVKLFKLFIMMILLLKWLSRPTSMLFKEAHHDHSGQYLMGS